MKRKLLALTIILTVSYSLLSGCGNTNISEKEATPTEVAEKTPDVEAHDNTEKENPVESEIPSEDSESETVSAPTDTEPQTIEPTVSEEVADSDTKEPLASDTEIAAEEPAQPTESTELTPVPLPEPIAVFTYTDLVQTMYAKSTVNVRDLPDTSGNKLGSLSAAQEVAVTGVCNETGWYKIDYNGTVAFVSNDYIVAEKPVAPAKTTSSGGMSRNIADYRQISSLSELTPALGWSVDFDGFCANYKNIPKVAYTYNGVTILLFDYTWNDGHGDWCVFYDFSRSHTSSPWSRNYFSSVHSIIDAGGYETYSYNLDGSVFYTWHPISNYQVY